MSRPGGPRGTPRGVERLGDRLEYQCDCCRDHVAAQLDEGTPWKCPACGHIHRDVELFVDDLLAAEQRAER